MKAVDEKKVKLEALGEGESLVVAGLTYELLDELGMGDLPEYRENVSYVVYKHNGEIYLATQACYDPVMEGDDLDNLLRGALFDVDCEDHMKALIWLYKHLDDPDLFEEEGYDVDLDEEYLSVCGWEGRL